MGHIVDYLTLTHSERVCTHDTHIHTHTHMCINLFGVGGELVIQYFIPICVYKCTAVSICLCPVAVSSGHAYYMRSLRACVRVCVFVYVQIYSNCVERSCGPIDSDTPHR